MSPSYTYYTSNTLADVQSVTYDDNYVYIESEGMTNDMGQFTNPGTPSGQGYKFIPPETQKQVPGKKKFQTHLEQVYW